MILKQYYLGCLSHASYIIADEETGVAAVVDPQRDIDQYLADAAEHGWSIRHVFLTHFHADFVAGHLELKDATGAEIHLGDRADAQYAFTPAHDGDVVQLGSVQIQILETPGHTPEGISLLVSETKPGSDEPSAVLTGDTLFIGDVGRPDLMASIGVTAEELGNQLYDSVTRLAQLSDDTLVYPAHGAGSMCGKNLSDATVSTIGAQKRENYAMQPMSREKFIEIVTADQPDAPDYFLYDAMKNREDRAVLGDVMSASVRPLTVDQVLTMRDDGAQLVDVRDAAEFASGHLPGSLNIGLRGKYATWAGTILRHDRPVIVLADSDDHEEAVMRLGRIGFDNVAGFLQGGVEVLQGQEDKLVQTQRITAVELENQLSRSTAPQVVDVRTAKEYAAGHIKGSTNLPLNDLEDQLTGLPRDRDLVIHCAGGYRSSLAASLLQKHGFSKVADLIGGYGAWQASTEETSVTGGSSCSAV
jgi:hydroxyacylglutathione hydrolase